MVWRHNQFPRAFDAIIDDIENHPDRAHKSVVLVTAGNENQQTQADLADQYIQEVYLPRLQELFRLGIPVVCAAGNEAEEQGRPNIDTLPAFLESEDTPLINLGATANNGNRIPMSQDGDLVTIYAPGDQVEGQSTTDMFGGVTSGTSLGESNSLP